MTQMPPPPFAGVPDAAFAFLFGLAEHQTRAWFDANKETYRDAVQGPLASLVGALLEALPEAGVSMRGDPRRSVFRIHRDTRFSRDKRPYKTNAGLSLSRDGGKLSPGLLYVHVAPEGCFTAAGFYYPEPPVLAALRTAIADDPQAWRAAVSALADGGLMLGHDEDALKRTPRGFESVTEPDLVAALRCRSLVVSRPLSRAEVQTPELVRTVVAFAHAALPLLSFGWSAIETAAAQRP